ncbi:MAG: response regulator transcription factor [Anaerolineales bacterium]|nr:response regulator transcription factor [Anaerolineales bacterium]
MNEKITILLAEDHVLVRAGIRALLQSLPYAEVVAEAGNGQEAIELIKALNPNIVLMDISMPILNGLEVTRQIVQEMPDVRIIMLSMHMNEEYVLQALNAGAAGYLLKDSGTAELEMAIRSVFGGETYLSPPVSKHIADYVRRVGSQTSMLERLTPRQREILQLIAEGQTVKEIAAQLNISAKTVETHRARLMRRLDIYDVPGLVHYAIRMGLVTLN